MNLIFHENLDEFLFIYIDDILMYSKIVKTCGTLGVHLKENEGKLVICELCE
jgi:hypothetical protein